MLEEAIRKNETKDLIIHSDQGFHYQNRRYIASLEDNKITQSMSRKGNCLDNSPIENFFGILKTEVYYQEEFKTVNELKNKIDKYIQYYNNERISLKLKGLTPIEYRNQSSNC